MKDKRTENVLSFGCCTTEESIVLNSMLPLDVLGIFFGANEL